MQYKNLLKRKDMLLEVSRLLPQRIQQHNNVVANNRIPRAYELIGNVEGRKLDRQQMTCIVKLNDLPKESTVFFIGRYSFDEKLLSDSGILDCRYNNAENTKEILYRKRPDLKMSFITAHKSKGLQADYIFIINNKKSRMGFPSKIQDSPILNLLLDNCEQFPYAEERRLYYVSLTRAKKNAYIVTVKGKESEFAMELKRQYGEELKHEQFTCPECGGRLIKRTGKYGDFFGCSNYSTKGCKYTRKIMSRDATRSQSQIQK